MVRLLAGLVLIGVSVNAQTVTETFGSGENQFQIGFVEIGNPNNPPDTQVYSNSDTFWYREVGSVGYSYNLSKYEVSRDMIIKANMHGNLEITLSDLSNFGGNGENRPATGITWYEAAKFVNWLNTSGGHQAAYNFDSDGNFQNWGSGQFSGDNQYRHKDAYYFLPTANEWYKGAYGSPNGTWYKYSTESDSAPIAISGGTEPGTAVWKQTGGPADIYNAGGLSGYGTMAQGGNVWEWTESAHDGVNNNPNEERENRGGNWSYFSFVEASVSYGITPDVENNYGGFRVASVPEPSSLSLLFAGGAVLMAGRRRK